MFVKNLPILKEKIPMKYIIDFIDSLTLSEIDQYLADNTITKINQFGSFGNVFLVESTSPLTDDHEFVVSVILDDTNAIDLLSTITLIDQSAPTSFSTEDAKEWWKVASLYKVDFDEAIQHHPVRGQNSTVYIIDSGITIDHAEFANSDITLLYSFNDDFVDNKGHGTALSSLIVGPNCGLANPKLKVIKIFDTNQPTYQSDLIAALDAIYADYLSNDRKVSVVNMSWVIPKNDYINSKIQFLINNGIYVVAAAGNNGLPITDVTPASIPDVLTIGSFGQDLTPSAFSDYTDGSDISYTANDVNYGALDGWAPGEMIWAANKNGGYGYIAGTSASAAIASAAFAYNMSVIATNDGIFRDTGLVDESLLAIRTLGRENILDLADQKYSNSVNKVVTYHNKMNGYSGFYAYQLQFTAGAISREFLIAHPFIIDTITHNGDLPNYVVSLNDSGWIKFNYPEIDELVINPPSLEFVTTNRDGSSTYIVVNITVLQQGYTDIDDIIETNPEFFEDNPELKYILKDDFNCQTIGNECVDVSGGCANLNGICNPLKFTECFCTT
jgi:hypothetical protein